MKKEKFKYVSTIIALSYSLSVSSSLLAPAVLAQESKSQEATKAVESTKVQESAKVQQGKGQTTAPDQESAKVKEVVKEDTKTKEAQKPETPIENVVAVTTEQLANKPDDYLNKNVKFTAPFFVFSNLALDYKPAFRSSRTYLSFLVLRPNSHTPFSEIKLAMLIPKEKDPLTKMLGTLKEGDVVEITGHVFASSLDEPWLDVLRVKKIASAPKSNTTEDKAADDKESSEDQSSDK